MVSTWLVMLSTTFRRWTPRDTKVASSARSFWASTRTAFDSSVVPSKSFAQKVFVSWASRSSDSARAAPVSTRSWRSCALYASSASALRRKNWPIVAEKRAKVGVKAFAAGTCSTPNSLAINFVHRKCAKTAPHPAVNKTTQGRAHAFNCWGLRYYIGLGTEGRGRNMARPQAPRTRRTRRTRRTAKQRRTRVRTGLHYSTRGWRLGLIKHLELVLQPENLLSLLHHSVSKRALVHLDVRNLRFQHADLALSRELGLLLLGATLAHGVLVSGTPGLILRVATVVNLSPSGCLGLKGVLALRAVLTFNSKGWRCRMLRAACALLLRK
eukprot:m.257810 g.257810  ORF g.257810 m.257810 type:complete len:326 (-) comp54572_c1_seq2:355-1332(-)